MGNILFILHMQITPPSWLPSQLQAIKPMLDGIAPWRLVGGVVRDIILDSPTMDIDIAISARPEEVLATLSQHNLNVVATGLKHGTITVYMPGDIRFEITSLRKDENCDGRHATVSFTDNWQEDASRRDFTINAMYLDMEGNLYDYFDGYNHLLHKKLIFVGNPKQRIKEDYLRALRYWRFLATIGLPNIDHPSQDAAVELFSGLNNIAGERICTEMFKLLSGVSALDVINTMISKQIMQHLELNLTHNLTALTTDPMLNLAIMLKHQSGGATPQAISNLTSRWKLSKAQGKLLHSLCLPKIKIDWKAPMLEQKKYIYLLGWQRYAQLFTIADTERKIYINHISLLKNFTPPILPLTGNDIGFLKGPAVGAALATAEKYWLENNFSPSKDSLLLYIKRIYS